MSADRIETTSLVTNLIESNLGESLDLSSNESINIRVESAVGDLVGYSVRIDAPNGLYLSDTNPSVVLNASVILYDGTDITDDTDADNFAWIRISDDENADLLWNADNSKKKTIIITEADVLTNAMFECRVTIHKGENTRVYYDSVSVSNLDNIFTSDEAPTSPANNMLWLDTSVSPASLKRWVVHEDGVGTWEDVIISPSHIDEIDTFVERAGSELNMLDTKIEAKIFDTTYTKDEVNEKVASVTMTNDKFTLMFGQTVENGINNRLLEMENYRQSVQNYLSYDDTGTLTLGSNGTADGAFKTQITNRQMSFVQGEKVVAYISDQSMYITNARVTDTLSIGGEDGQGYFDWVVTETGLGLKWRSKS